MPVEAPPLTYDKRLEARTGTNLVAPAWPRVHMAQAPAAMLVPDLQHGKQVVEPVPRA